MKNTWAHSIIFCLFVTCFVVQKGFTQPAITITGPNEVCVGDVVSYSATPSHNGTTLHWSIGSEALILNGGNSSALVQFVNSGNIVLNVQEKDPSNTLIAQANLTISIKSKPSPIITASSMVGCAAQDTLHKGGFIVDFLNEPCIKACANSTVTYAVENSPNTTFNWVVVGDVSHSVSGNLCTVEWGDAGWGNIYVEEDNGICIGTDTLCVKIIEQPVAQFYSPTQEIEENVLNVCLNSNAIFIDQSISMGNSPIVSWIWNFGDGTIISTGAGGINNSVEHAYTYPGHYTIQLVVTNACGCSSEYKIEVFVNELEGGKIECPRVVCFAEETTYISAFFECSEASWNVIGGNYNSNSTSATVLWDMVDESGFGYVTYHNPCGECPSSTTVKIPVVQEEGAIQGPNIICSNKKVMYSMPQWPTTTFDWHITGDATLLPSDQPNIVWVQPDEFGHSFEISVTYCNTLLNCNGSAVLEVAILPEIEIIGERIFCIGDNAIYSTNQATTVNWTVTDPNGTSFNFNNQIDISLGFEYSGTYIIEIQDENYCSPTPFFVTVYPKPAKPTLIYGPTEVCKFTPISYTASPHISGTSFQWSVSSGSVNPQEGIETNISFNTLPATIDVVRATTDGSGCQSEPFTQTVETVMPSVSILTNAPNEVCGSTQWNFETDYADGDLYQWKILSPEMGSKVSGNYTPEVEIQFNNPIGTSEYVAVIVAVTKCGSVKRDTLIVQVKKAPAYTASASATTVCANEQVDFTISPTPVGYTSLHWDFGDGGSSNSLTTSHTFTGNTDIAEHTPTVTVVNPEGCISTMIIATDPVMVKPAPVAHISPGNSVACGPFSQQLTATISTGISSTANIKWFGPTGSNPPAPNCQTCDSWTVSQYGTYYIEVENSLGCTSVSNEIQIVENCDDCPGPKPTVISQDSLFTDCAEVQANFNYSTNGLNIIDEYWIYPVEAFDITQNTGTQAWIKASFPKAGVYVYNYHIYTNDCNWVYDQKVYVPFVGDMRYTVSCGSGNLYDVTLFDHSNIYPGEVGHIHHTYAYKEGSNPWQTIAAPWNAEEVFLQLPAGDYQFMKIIESDLTTAAPPCTTIVSVNLPEKPDADFIINSPFVPACVYDVVIGFTNLTTPTTELQYEWDFMDNSTSYLLEPQKTYSDLGVYDITLTATNDRACSDTKTKTIAIIGNGYWNYDQKPEVDLNPTPPICSGLPITLIYNEGNFGAPPLYTWYQGNIPLTTPVNSSIYAVTQPGNYWVMGSGASGCLVPSDAVSVDFIQPPIPSIVGNNKYCADEEFTLKSSVSDIPGVTQEWSLFSNPIGTGSTLTQTVGPGIYIYTLTVTQNGCEVISAPFEVEVFPSSEPTLAYDIMECDPYVVRITATHPQNGIFNWNTGATGSVIEVNAGGVYSATFTSEAGCVTNSYIDVPKSPHEYIWTYPSGCFCEEDFLITQDECFDRNIGPHISGPIIPFYSWEYYNESIGIASGNNTIPDILPIAFIEALENQLVLRNDYCEAISDPLYYSHECPNSGPQFMRPNPQDQIINGLTNTHDIDASVRLLPNPAGYKTQIAYQFNNEKSQNNIVVFDLSGKRMHTHTPEWVKGFYDLNLSTYPPGVYEICLVSDGIVVAQTKLIVNP